MVLHVKGTFAVGDSVTFLVVYSLIPCLVLMTVGPSPIPALPAGSSPAGLDAAFRRLQEGPLPCYILHLPLLHAMAVPVALYRIGRAERLFTNPPARTGPTISTSTSPCLFGLGDGQPAALPPLPALCHLQGETQGPAALIPIGNGEHA